MLGETVGRDSKHNGYGGIGVQLWALAVVCAGTPNRDWLLGVFDWAQSAFKEGFC